MPVAAKKNITELVDPLLLFEKSKTPKFKEYLGCWRISTYCSSSKPTPVSGLSMSICNGCIKSKKRAWKDSWPEPDSLSLTFTSATTKTPLIIIKNKGTR